MEDIETGECPLCGEVRYGCDKCNIPLTPIERRHEDLDAEGPSEDFSSVDTSQL